MSLHFVAVTTGGTRGRVRLAHGEILEVTEMFLGLYPREVIGVLRSEVRGGNCCGALYLLDEASNMPPK